MLFSIITVCFNSANTIRRTLESVLKQEFKEYEYLVIDGASTDGTLDVLREYEPAFGGRMHLLSEPDGGIYEAMNKGIGMARGDFLNFLNSNDYYEPDTLQILQKAIRDHAGFDLYYGITRFFDERGELKLERRSHERLPEAEMINHQAIWYQKELFSRYGKYELKYRICADYEHLLRLYSNGCRFYPVSNVVVNYDANGISRCREDVFEYENILIRHQHHYLSETGYRKALQTYRWEKCAFRIFQKKLRELLLQMIKSIFFPRNQE